MGARVWLDTCLAIEFGFDAKCILLSLQVHDMLNSMISISDATMKSYSPLRK